MELIGILIIAFSTLLYDEVVIINKCGLNQNVRKGIINRGEKEVVKNIELELANEEIIGDCDSPENDIKIALQNEIGDSVEDDD